MKKVPEEKINEIIRLHAQGLIDKEIGKILGVCSDAIFYHRKKLKLLANGPSKKELIIDENGYRKCHDCDSFLSEESFEKDKDGNLRRTCFLCRKKEKKKSYEKSKNSLEKNLLNRCRYWKKRAKDNNIPYNIDYEYVLEILNKQYFKCFYSGLDMSLNGTTHDHSYSLSIDKVIPSLGYVKGNIVFCLHKINLIKSNMTLDEIKKWTPSFYDKIINSKLLNQQLISDLK